MQTVVGKKSFLERKRDQEDMFDESPSEDKSEEEPSISTSNSSSLSSLENSNELENMQLQHLIEKAQPESSNTSMSYSGGTGSQQFYKKLKLKFL